MTGNEESKDLVQIFNVRQSSDSLSRELSRKKE
jgi:hypothetical protein